MSTQVRASLRRALGVYLERPAARALTWAGVSPDAVTVVGLVVALTAAGLVGAGYLLAGGLVLLASGVFDMLDGALARATGRAGPFGALLDSTVDRVSEAAVLFGVSVHFLFRDSSLVVLLSFLALTGSLMVSYVRARAEALDVDCEVGVMTRTERVVALSAALVAAQWLPMVLVVVLGAIAALGMATAAYRVAYARRRLQERG